MTIIKNDWEDFLLQEREKPYFETMMETLNSEYQTKNIYPNKADVFNCFRYTALADTKVILLGQDPYHQPQQACGLSFAVRPGIKVPPSLVNIYQELATDLKLPIPNHGYILPWAKQGVLLLNTVLTVEHGKPNSHKNLGWLTFTNNVLKYLNQEKSDLVFLLLGRNAQSKIEFLTNPTHLILTAPHPSPLSAYQGFFGSRHFSQTNDFLKKQGLNPIDWRIENV